MRAAASGRRGPPDASPLGAPHSLPEGDCSPRSRCPGRSSCSGTSAGADVCPRRPAATRSRASRACDALSADSPGAADAAPRGLRGVRPIPAPVLELVPECLYRDDSSGERPSSRSPCTTRLRIAKRGRLELACPPLDRIIRAQALRTAPGSNQLNPLTPEGRRVRRSCSRHGGYLLLKGSGVHQNGSTPLYAMTRCELEGPELQEIEPGRFSACHLTVGPPHFRSAPCTAA